MCTMSGFFSLARLLPCWEEGRVFLRRSFGGVLLSQRFSRFLFWARSTGRSQGFSTFHGCRGMVYPSSPSNASAGLFRYSWWGQRLMLFFQRGGFVVHNLTRCFQRSVRDVPVRHGEAPGTPEDKAENPQRLDGGAEQQRSLRQRRLQGDPGAAMAVPRSYQGDGGTHRVSGRQWSAALWRHVAVARAFGRSFRFQSATGLVVA